MVSTIRSSLKSVELICLGVSSLVLVEDRSKLHSQAHLYSCLYLGNEEREFCRENRGLTCALFLCV